VEVRGRVRGDLRGSPDEGGGGGRKAKPFSIPKGNGVGAPGLTPLPPLLAL